MKQSQLLTVEVRLSDKEAPVQIFLRHLNGEIFATSGAKPGFALIPAVRVGSFSEASGREKSTVSRDEFQIILILL